MNYSGGGSLSDYNQPMSTSGSGQPHLAAASVSNSTFSRPGASRYSSPPLGDTPAARDINGSGGGGGGTLQRYGRSQSESTPPLQVASAGGSRPSSSRLQKYDGGGGTTMCTSANAAGGEPGINLYGVETCTGTLKRSHSVGVASSVKPPAAAADRKQSPPSRLSISGETDILRYICVYIIIMREKKIDRESREKS